MKPQEPQAPQIGATQFVRVLDQALVFARRHKQTYMHAFDIGIRAPDLMRYVSGKLEEVERREFQGLLARSPWAMARVVALVKAKRQDTGPRVLFYDSNEQSELEALKLLDQF